VSEQFLILDYETRSECDLKKTGAYEYSNHPTTEILCVAWRFGTKDTLTKNRVQCWTPQIPAPYGELVRALLDNRVYLVAHNAFFEQVITRFVLSRIIHKEGIKNIPIERWICTAAQAAALSIPRSLEGASLALGLRHQKDVEGRKLMLKMCKPRRPSRENPSRWHETPEDIERLMDYCKKDVEAETELFLKLPRLTPQERKIWCLDQTINWRGFGVDRHLVDRALDLIDEEKYYLNKETRELTKGFPPSSTTQRESLLCWIEQEGFFLPDLKAKTVADTLKEGYITGDCKRLLEIRQAISKSSTAKYEAFEARSRTDGRIRDHLVYHAAHTGRWGGAGIQPQNFPRGHLKNASLASESIKDGDLELIRLLYGDPMLVFSSCLRSVIQASPGMTLYCADYNAIEARVLFWLAEHKDGLKAFREERDLYCEMASVIFNREITKADEKERFIGKQTVLGCGYQMGWKKFMGTCDTLGQPVEQDIAERAIDAYRSTHSPVATLWGKMERIAIAACQNPGKRFKTNRLSWFKRGDFLYCELPSGRRFAYYGAEVKHELTSWGERAPRLYYWGTNQKTRQWESLATYGGKLTENIVQAISRDLMAESMLRHTRAGYDILLTAHDEELAEKKNGDLKEFIEIMSELPSWAEGLPIKVSGWEGPRYKK